MLFLGVGTCHIRAQNISLKIVSTNDKNNLKGLSYKKNFNNTAAALKEVDNVLWALRAGGYLLAEADSLRTDSTQVFARLNPGQVYKVATIRPGNLEPGLAIRFGLGPNELGGKPLRYGQVAASLERIVVYYENNGYPFASAQLDSVSVLNGALSAALRVEKNRFFKLDSITVFGSAKINKNFLHRYLGIKEKMPYNEAAMAAISQKIRQLPFLTETQPQRVILSNKSNKLQLFLDKKSASQFDGIVGILPDANTGKTVITGDVKLKLVNGIFRNGETFDLEWRRLQLQTSDFNGKIIYPFLFGTPVGTDYNLKLYRRDTTFIDINQHLGLQYYFGGLNHLRFFYRQRSNNLISTSGYQFATTLPEYADIRTGAYGLGVFYENLDYRFNPRRGVAINVSSQAGLRNIKQNPAINEAAYQNVVLRSTQYQAEGSLAWYIGLKGNSVLKLGVQGASVFGSAGVFRNELFRIGGLKTLRGFDEESIFASTYVIPTLEYRFLFAQNSHLLVFTEGAWYENTANRKYVNDRPLSFGAGINFETKAGILSINYALGQQFGNGFDGRNGKIHFGLTALF